MTVLSAPEALDAAIAAATGALAARRHPDGHWDFPLEADATIPAEYVLLEHFLDRIDPDLEARIGRDLRARQGMHGGWPLFAGGALDLSCSVKAYYALRCIGDPADAPHMARARAAILAAGGAERANVFTRAQLALFGQVPWRAVPMMPLEIMHLPLWFPFHLSKVSYWSRTVIVPLLVLMGLRPRARNPRNVHVPELFRTPPEQVADYIRGPYRSAWGRFFKAVDVALRAADPLFPRRSRNRAIDKAVAFVTERLNGEDGLGGIYPAMANAVMMFDTLGFPPDAPPAATAWASVRKLIVPEGDSTWVSPCLSPVWDTGLAAHAMAEAAGGASDDVDAACAWLRGRQITEVAGDWSVRRPDLRPGGWAFQYWNDHYPDVDDTAVVGMLLHRQGDPAHAESIARAREWILGMQSKGGGHYDGGWGAFE
ncbi:MAG: squalene--hopene cyclase, partial [Rhodospirillales bacterium]|nr:squalene--hopene cyclase [Rhodospirillales bacterium]